MFFFNLLHGVPPSMCAREALTSVRISATSGIRFLQKGNKKVRYFFHLLPTIPRPGDVKRSKEISGIECAATLLPKELAVEWPESETV